MSLDELKKELYGDIREFSAELVKCDQRKNTFVKETRCDYESFVKRQKKERKRAAHHRDSPQTEVKESKAVLQKSFVLPSDCAIRPNSVLDVYLADL